MKTSQSYHCIPLPQDHEWAYIKIIAYPWEIMQYIKINPKGGYLMSNMHKNNKLLAVLCLVAAITLGLTSSLVTAKLFMSFDNTWFKYVLLCVGICLDFGKFAFPAVGAFQFQKEKYVSTIIYALLAVACIGVSFLASMSYDFNQANEISNETVTGSGAYQRQESLFKTTNDSIATQKSDIASMKANRPGAEKQIRADYSSRIETARKLKYLTTPKIGVDALSAERDIKIAKLDADIQAKESSLKESESNLSGVNTGFATVSSQVKTTKGIMALATWFNSENPEKALGQINFTKNILIEIVAIAFSMAFGALVSGKGIFKSEHSSSDHEPMFYDSKEEVEAVGYRTPNITGAAIGTMAKKSDEESPVKKTEYAYGTSEKINSIPCDELKTKYPIGFRQSEISGHDKKENPVDTVNSKTEKPSNSLQAESVEYDYGDILTYLTYMYNNKKGDQSPGTDKLKGDTYLSYKQIKGIRYHLEQKGIVKIGEKKTSILIPDLNQAISIVSVS